MIDHAHFPPNLPTMMDPCRGTKTNDLLDPIHPVCVSGVEGGRLKGANTSSSPGSSPTGLSSLGTSRGITVHDPIRAVCVSTRRQLPALRARTSHLARLVTHCMSSLLLAVSQNSQHRTPLLCLEPSQQLGTALVSGGKSLRLRTWRQVRARIQYCRLPISLHPRSMRMDRPCSKLAFQGEIARKRPDALT